MTIGSGSFLTATRSLGRRVGRTPGQVSAQRTRAESLDPAIEITSREKASHP